MVRGSSCYGPSLYVELGRIGEIPGAGFWKIWGQRKSRGQDFGKFGDKGNPGGRILANLDSKFQIS